MKIYILLASIIAFSQGVAQANEYVWKCSQQMRFQTSDKGFHGSSDAKLVASEDGTFSLIEEDVAPAEFSPSKRTLATGLTCTFAKDDHAIFECSSKTAIESVKTGCSAPGAKCIIIGGTNHSQPNLMETSVRVERSTKTSLKYHSDETITETVVKISGYSIARPGIETTWRYSREFSSKACSAE